ncbi:MAG TPA: stage III sporulation protein AA [Bacilli bacterium]
MLESVLSLLPEPLHSQIRRLPRDVLSGLEELRIRAGRPLEIGFSGDYAFVTAGGEPTRSHLRAFIPDRELCRKLIDILTCHSVYALEEELKRGYITIRGGHRVGIAGGAAVEQGKVKFIKDIASFNIRIARQVIGVGAALLPGLVDVPNQTICHTLIVSPPQQGKTTLIRDLARLLSSGEWPNGLPWRGKKVGIVDERSEIAGCEAGVPTFDLGPRTDVLDRCPKAEGMMMLIRSMSPEVLVVDEIGTAEDAEALKEAIKAGVRVLATAHGADLAELACRPTFREMIAGNLFERFVILRRSGGGTPEMKLCAADGSQLVRVAAGAAAAWQKGMTPC